MFRKVRKDRSLDKETGKDEIETGELKKKIKEVFKMMLEKINKGFKNQKKM